MIERMRRVSLNAFLASTRVFATWKETLRMADRVGQQLGNYRLLRKIGQGAFADVYLAEHQYLERLAAIKANREILIAGLHVENVPGITDLGVVNQSSSNGYGGFGNFIFGPTN